jgi:ABC-type phosphonate transport system ATPase subunit
VHDDNNSNNGQFGQVVGMGGSGKPKIISCVSQHVMDEVGGITTTLKTIQKSLEKTSASDVEMTMVMCYDCKSKMRLCI